MVTFNPTPLIVATGGSLRQTARMLDIDPANLCRPLSSRQADSYAIRLGYHPEEIWGAAWNDQDDDDGSPRGWTGTPASELG